MSRFLTAILILFGLAVIAGVFYSPSQAPHWGRLASQCQRNLKQLSLATYMYAKDHDGIYPSHIDSLVPKYITDPNLLNCPFHKRKGNDHGYVIHLPGRKIDLENLPAAIFLSDAVPHDRGYSRTDRKVAEGQFRAIRLADGTPYTVPEDEFRDRIAAQNRPLTVSVAAIQFHSRMGDVERNRHGLEALVKRAATAGAKIIVLPEAAVSGYASIERDIYWATKPEPKRGYIDVRKIAETVPGPSVKFFAGIAEDHEIYLTVPLVEKEGETYYNTVVLLGPEGRIRAHYRKQHLWPQADSSWATAGPSRACTVDTKYGRLGVMICYDVHGVLPKLIEAKADIVLHSVAWWGPNAGGWFEHTLSHKVASGKLSLVLANWSFPSDPGWTGHGHSMVIGPDGKLLGRTNKIHGDDIVFADVPIPEHVPLTREP